MDSVIFAAQFQNDFARFVDKQIEFHDKLIETLQGYKKDDNSEIEQVKKQLNLPTRENTQPNPRIVKQNDATVTVKEFSEEALKQLSGIFNDNIKKSLEKLTSKVQPKKEETNEGLMKLLSVPLGMLKSLFDKGFNLVSGAVGGLWTKLSDFLTPLLGGATGGLLGGTLGTISKAFLAGGPVILALGSIAASITDIYQWFNSSEEERNARSDKMLQEFQKESKRIQEEGLMYYFSLEGQLNSISSFLKIITNPADFGNMITNAVVKGIYENDPRVKELEISLENAKENRKIREAIEKLQNDIANDENFKDVKDLAQFLQKDVGESQKEFLERLEKAYNLDSESVVGPFSIKQAFQEIVDYEMNERRKEGQESLQRLKDSGLYDTILEESNKADITPEEQDDFYKNELKKFIKGDYNGKPETGETPQPVIEQNEVISIPAEMLTEERIHFDGTRSSVSPDHWSHSLNRHLETLNNTTNKSIKLQEQQLEAIKQQEKANIITAPNNSKTTINNFDTSSGSVDSFRDNVRKGVRTY